MREVENAVKSVERTILGGQAPLSGVVRVTSTDTFCHVVLPPVISQLQNSAAELRLELLCTNAHLNLSRMHADITVRPTMRLDDDLEGDIAAKLAFDVYATPGAPQDKWLGISGATARSRVAKWMGDNIDPGSISGAADSFLTLQQLAVAGLGQAILPCILGDKNPRLERRRGIIPDMPVDIWVASHTDLMGVPRIRAVRKMLIEALGAQRDALAGVF